MKTSDNSEINGIISSLKKVPKDIGKNVAGTVKNELEGLGPELSKTISILTAQSFKTVGKNIASTISSDLSNILGPEMMKIVTIFSPLKDGLKNIFETRKENKETKRTNDIITKNQNINEKIHTKSQDIFKELNNQFREMIGIEKARDKKSDRQQTGKKKGFFGKFSWALVGIGALMGFIEVQFAYYINKIKKALGPIMDFKLSLMKPIKKFGKWLLKFKDRWGKFGRFLEKVGEKLANFGTGEKFDFKVFKAKKIRQLIDWITRFFSPKSYFGKLVVQITNFFAKLKFAKGAGKIAKFFIKMKSWLTGFAPAKILGKFMGHIVKFLDPIFWIFDLFSIWTSDDSIGKKMKDSISSGLYRLVDYLIGWPLTFITWLINPIIEWTAGLFGIDIILPKWTKYLTKEKFQEWFKQLEPFFENIAKLFLIFISFEDVLTAKFNSIIGSMKSLMSGGLQQLDKVFVLIGKGIQLLGNSFVKIADVLSKSGKTSSLLVNIIGTLGEGIIAIGRNFGSIIKGPIKAIIKWTKIVWKFAWGLAESGKWIGKILAPIMRVVGKIALPLTIILGAFDFIFAFLNTEGTIVEKIKAGLIASVKGIIEFPTVLLGWISDWLLGLFGISVDGGVGKVLLDGIMGTVGFAIDTILYPFKMIWDSLQKIISIFSNEDPNVGFWDKLWEAGKEALRIIFLPYTIIYDSMMKVIDWFTSTEGKETSILDKIVNWLTELPSMIWDFVTNLLPSFDDIKNKVKDIGGSIWGGIKGVFGSDKTVATEKVGKISLNGKKEHLEAEGILKGRSKNDLKGKELEKYRELEALSYKKSIQYKDKFNNKQEKTQEVANESISSFTEAALDKGSIYTHDVHLEDLLGKILKIDEKSDNDNIIVVKSDDFTPASSNISNNTENIGKQATKSSVVPTSKKRKRQYERGMSDFDEVNKESKTENIPLPTPMDAVGKQAMKMIKDDGTLGSLSAKYESGNKGAGTVSSGRGDAGGASYGTYQMTSKGKGGGTVGRFLKGSGSKYAEQFEGMKPGSPEFTKKWKELAKSDEGFGKSQHDFIKATHFDPLAKKVKKDLGLDIGNRSKALQDVLWSTGVQHGGGTNVVNKALKGMDPSKMSDQEITKAIYAERGKKKKDGSLAYFSKNSANVQAGVAKRFKNEENDALARMNIAPEDTASEITMYENDKLKNAKESSELKMVEAKNLQKEINNNTKQMSVNSKSSTDNYVMGPGGIMQGTPGGVMKGEDNSSTTNNQMQNNSTAASHSSQTPKDIPEEVDNYLLALAAAGMMA